MVFKYNLEIILEKKVDDFLTEAILAHCGFLKYVHPNFITLTGFILNFYILYAMMHKLFLLATLAIFFRYFADCLDGGVARKYKKQSRIGGLFDTASDNILIYIHIIGIFYLFGIPHGNWVAASLCLLNLYVMSTSGALVDHAKIKVGSGSFSKYYAFFTNNTYIMFLFVILHIFVAWALDKDLGKQ